MKEQLIILAKEKGFVSNIIGKSVEAEYSKKDFYYLWLCELQKWLREIHDLIVIINYPQSIEEYTFDIKHKSDYNREYFETYGEALEKGSQEALNLI